MDTKTKQSIYANKNDIQIHQTTVGSVFELTFFPISKPFTKRFHLFHQDVTLIQENHKFKLN